MYVTERYTLSKDVIEAIKKQPFKFGFDGFGELVYYTNYSRRMHNGGQEGWIDTCKRVVEGVFSIRKTWYRTHGLKWDNHFWDDKAADLLYYMYTLKILPPGRGLWAQGTNYVYERGSMVLNNCGASVIKNDTFADDIGWIMDALMCGTGVGLKIEVDSSLKDRLELVPPTGSTSKIVTVEDSREGWVNSVIYLLNSYIKLSTSYVLFDYSKIRKLGTPIKGFGGTASGPEPLIKLHERIRRYMYSFITGRFDATRTFADIANAVGCCIVAGNVRRCLPKRTLIHTNKGLIQIENIKTGDKVLTAEGYHEVTEIIYQGKQKLVSIKTELGEFKCTGIHRVAVLADDSSYSWKYARDLTKGDSLVFIQSLMEGTNTKLPAYSYVKPNIHSTTCKDIKVPDLDADMAWFFGMLHGNGYVYPNKNKNGFNAYVSVCTHKEYPHILFKCEEQLERFGVNIYNPPNKDNCIRASVQSKQLALYLSKFKTANKSLDIPDFILEGNIQVRGAYLAGVFDSDGSCRTRPVILVSSIYLKFLKQVQSLYATFGITTRVKCEREKKGNWKTLYSLSIIGKLATSLFCKFIGNYSLKYKKKENYKFNSQLDNIVDNKIPVKVIKVEGSDTDETYDLSIEGRNEFVAQEGLLVHNSAEIILGDINDGTFLNLKNYKLHPERQELGWMSNNTVCLEHSNDFLKLDRIIDNICENGEPGILNLINVQKYERFGYTHSPDLAHMCNPCGEIPLENKELCNLIEMFPMRAKSKKDFLKMCELATIYATSVSLLPTHNEETNAVIVRNRRIGTSISGVADWFDTWGAFKIVKFMRKGYSHIREFSNYLSAQAGVPNPIRVTTVKPSGTVSQVAGVSPGMHFPIHKYAIRRMRISETSPILKMCEQAGFPIEKDVYSKESTYVVEYPIFTGNTRPVSQVSAWEQFSLLALLQREWSDNMVSCTINFTEKEKVDLPRMLAHFLPLIKSVSLLPTKEGVYPQMPYEKITEEEYNKRRKGLKSIDWDGFTGSDGKESKFCSNDSCEI